MIIYISTIKNVNHTNGHVTVSLKINQLTLNLFSIKINYIFEIFDIEA
jgi:hypothetical protein